MGTDFDYVIIGSGFGGSVSALRLAEKGYRVLVLEKGKRLAPSDFPKTNWELSRWMWNPALGLHGIFQMTFLRHVTVAARRRRRRRLARVREHAPDPEGPVLPVEVVGPPRGLEEGARAALRDRAPHARRRDEPAPSRRRTTSSARSRRTSGARTRSSRRASPSTSASPGRRRAIRTSAARAPIASAARTAARA